MTIETGFIEYPPFPRGIALGASGGPTFSTTKTQVLNGSTKTIRNWKNPLHKFEVSFGVRDQDQLDELLDFFWGCGGTANNFRFWNPMDYKIKQSTCGFSAEDGTYQGGNTFKIYQKKQLTAMIKSWRRITKPVEGTFILYKNGLPASDYVMDYTQGKVTLGTTFMEDLEPTDILTFVCEFDTPCCFGKDDMMPTIDNYEIYSWNQIPIYEVRIKEQ